MEMRTAADGTPTKQSKNAEYFRNSQVVNISGCNPAMTCALQKTRKESEVETKTRKDEFASNSSPVKVSKKFRFQTKDIRPQSEDLSETKQCQQQPNVFECLKAHNKRHGIVIDNNDTQFTDALDNSINFAGTVRQDNERKGYFYDDYKCQERNGLTQVERFQLRRPQSSYTYRTDKSGATLCSKSASGLNQNVMSKHYQSQTGKNELPGLRNSQANETDPLKSTPDVCNINYFHRTIKDLNDHANSSNSRVRAEKYVSQSLGESLVKRSQSSSHDLCMQCQKCETRQKEKVTGCEKTLDAFKSEPSMFKNGGSEVCDTNLCNSDKSSTAANPDVGSEDNISTITSHISSNVPLNDLNEGTKPPITEKIKQISLTPESVTANCTERLKSGVEHNSVCVSDMVSPINSSLTCFGQQKQDRTIQYTLSPIKKPTTSSDCQSPSLTYNMPDVTKVSVGVTCSKNVAGQNDLTDVPLQNSSDGEAANHMSAADICLGENKIFSDACNFMERNCSSVINTSLLDNCDEKKISVTQSSMSVSLEKIVATPNSGHYFSNMSQNVPSETKSRLKKEQNTSDQLSRSRSVVLPKTFPSRDCSQSFIKKETDNGVIIKRFSLEDKEFLEHRYRLYYDDETNSSRNLKQSENPKSLKALSASSMIAENFKQLPRDTNSSYDKNRKMYNQAAFYLTVSSPSDGLSERQASLSLTESKLTGVSEPFLIQPHTNPNMNPKIVPTQSNSESWSQLAGCRSSIVTRQGKVSADNNHSEVHQTNCSHTSHAEEMDMLNDKHSDELSAHYLGSKENETSLKLYQTNNSLGKDRNTFSSTMSECSSRLQATAPFSDESSSYKPKNPQPVMTSSLLSNASECQSLNTDDKSSSDYPHFSVKNVTTQHLPTSEHEISGSNLNLLPCKVSASYNHESNLQLTRINGHKINDEIKGSESYRCQQSGNDSLYTGSQSFLRSNSPSDFFSIRPYVDYTASKASSDSGVLVLSDHVRNRTSSGTKSTIKGSSSEKLDNGRRHVGNRKVKSGSEKDSKCCKSQNKCNESVNISDDVEHRRSNYSRRSRHSDGVKIRAQEQKCYQLQYPRYSADSSSLISNAFLQKMAHLSQYTVRPELHPHDDIHLNSSVKHTSISGDSPRKTPGPNGAAECCVSLGTQSSRNIRMSSNAAKKSPLPHSSSFNTSKEEVPPMNCEHHKTRINSASTDTITIRTSPDLLPSHDDLKEEGATKEKSQLSKKAQSFFSKLTHSPISFFYRDNKSSNPPK